MDDRGVGVQVPKGLENSLLHATYPASQPLDTGGGGISSGVKRDGSEANHSPTNLQLVPRLRKRGSVHPLPHTFSWHSG
jgi:hypothetical protein